MKVQGFVHKYGNNVDTDVIIPARYLNVSGGDELKVHCMEDIDPQFASNVKQGDMIVAGDNFGCGSSREHAPLAIKCSGISCVIAKSFARIFYRNAINIGLPIMECEEAADAINKGDEVSIDFDSGKITNLSTGKEYFSQPFPPFIQDIIANGGLISQTKKEMDNNGKI
ncbi:MAG: 3-isopropylmalate dehydratase small subunit [Clostridia bacterium]|nr:3-isopropylmalate dehydratase small subunit [Clostridia bacterium]